MTTHQHICHRPRSISFSRRQSLFTGATDSCATDLHFNSNMSSEETTPPAKVVAKPQNSAIKDFLAGGVGGVCTVIAGHPLDTIKVSTEHKSDITWTLYPERIK